MDSGSTEPINSVVPDEDLIDQVVPDGEELKEWETSPTPTLEQALCVMTMSAEDRRIPKIKNGNTAHVSGWHEDSWMGKSQIIGVRWNWSSYSAPEDEPK